MKLKHLEKTMKDFLIRAGLITLALILIVVAATMSACDKPGNGSPKKLVQTGEKIYTPSQLTVDVELLQSKGIIKYETIITDDEILEIGHLLYSETEDWRIKDQSPTGPTHPHQLSQFIYKYAGYWIDTREVVTLVRYGEPATPPANSPTPPSQGP